MPVFSLIYLQERKSWGLSTSVCSSSKWGYSQHINHKVVMKANELIYREHFKQCRQRGILSKTSSSYYLYYCPSPGDWNHVSRGLILWDRANESLIKLNGKVRKWFRLLKPGRYLTKNPLSMAANIKKAQFYSWKKPYLVSSMVTLVYLSIRGCSVLPRLMEDPIVCCSIKGTLHQSMSLPFILKIAYRVKWSQDWGM